MGRQLGMKISNMTLCLGISLILLASSRAQMFSDEAKMINENQTYTVRGVINVVHLPIPDGDQHGSEQGLVTGGYFFLFTPELYTLNGREIDENGEDKPVQIKDQQIFQLAPDEHQVAKIEAAVTKPVELEVQPFIRHTMSHHTPVLFRVSSVKVIEGAVKEWGKRGKKQGKR
jgi:hypothetical protein